MGQRDDKGRLGDTVCIVILTLVDQADDPDAFSSLVRWIEREVSHRRIHFFNDRFAFKNISLDGPIAE